MEKSENELEQEGFQEADGGLEEGSLMLDDVVVEMEL